jgi:enterochelin esterase-like enzyme
MLFRFIVLKLLLVLVMPSVVYGQEGTLEWGEITSSALQGNLLGDPATRSFAVYLSPNYETSQKRYPSFYMLHGVGQNEGIFTGMRNTIDSMIQDGEIEEMIAVFVDGTNSLGGSWYFSLVTLGDYETYITQDLVNYVDAHYRTIAHRNSRGITGFSMGAHGSMHLALKFPDVFGAVVAQAGVYDMDSLGLYDLTVPLD